MPGERRDFRPGEQIALQRLGPPGEGARGAQPLDEALREPVEFGAQRMVGICPCLLDEGDCRGHDLAQQIGIGAIELEHRRQLLTDFLPQGRQRLLVGQELLQHAQQLVEQAPVLAFLGDRAQQAGSERRDLDLLKLRLHALGQEPAQARPRRSPPGPWAASGSRRPPAPRCARGRRARPPCGRRSRPRPASSRPSRAPGSWSR